MDCEIGIIYFIRLIYFYSISICDNRDGVYKMVCENQTHLIGD